jgi:outer membrane protein assembly factor BamB
MLGEELWVSSALDGVNAGSPVVSLDGTFVFLTHNSASQSVGHFSILDGLTGDLFHSESSLWSPFAPLGIHHAPAEGYYDGGQENRNDILVWSFRPMPNETSVAAGAMFGFQFPIGFSGQQEVGLFRLGGDDREFRAISRPVFANDGRSLYIGTTKSMYRCWVGKVGLNRHRFSRAKTSSIGFTRGNPANQAVWAPLALSQVEEELYLFGGTAANEFIRLNTNFSNDLMISTTSLVKTEARISPDNLYVYYVELEGHLHQASTANLADKWIYRFRESVEGEFSLTKDGTVIFIADVTGLIHALRVANHTTESPPPSIQPTSSPSKMVSQTPQPSAGKLDPICQDILANGGPVERGRLSSDAVSLLSYRSSSFGLCCYVYALFFFVVSY